MPEADNERHEGCHAEFHDDCHNMLAAGGGEPPHTYKLRMPFERDKKIIFRIPVIGILNRILKQNHISKKTRNRKTYGTVIKRIN